MEIKTKNFGVVEFQDNDLILFPKGLPGLTSLKRFLILAFDEMQPLKFLQSVDEPIYSFVLVNPLLLDPQYNYDLSEEDYTDINLEPDEEVLQYIIVTVPNDPNMITGNFKAPILINTKTMQAKQVILADSKYSVSTSVPEILNSQALNSEIKS